VSCLFMGVTQRARRFYVVISKKKIMCIIHDDDRVIIK